MLTFNSLTPRSKLTSSYIQMTPAADNRRHWIYIRDFSFNALSGVQEIQIAKFYISCSIFLFYFIQLNNANSLLNLRECFLVSHHFPSNRLWFELLLKTHKTTMDNLSEIESNIELITRKRWTMQLARLLQLKMIMKTADDGFDNWIFGIGHLISEFSLCGCIHRCRVLTFRVKRNHTKLRWLSFRGAASSSSRFGFFPLLSRVLSMTQNSEREFRS